MLPLLLGLQFKMTLTGPTYTIESISPECCVYTWPSKKKSQDTATWKMLIANFNSERWKIIPESYLVFSEELTKLKNFLNIQSNGNDRKTKPENNEVRGIVEPISGRISQSGNPIQGSRSKTAIGLGHIEHRTLTFKS